MTRYHINNTLFEKELESGESHSFFALLSEPKLAIQLQYLPRLFKNDDDCILVTHQDDSLDNSVYCLDMAPFKKGDEILSWGYSRLIQQFAKKHGLIYKSPSFDVVKKVNSKLFSFKESPQLKGACLIEKEAFIPNNGVLKSAFGFSGRGHFFLGRNMDPLPFFKKAVEQTGFVIYEPWVERTLDFSTQWMLQEDESIVYLGATLLKNSNKGSYLGTIVGEEKQLFGKYYPFLQEHKSILIEILKKMIKLGFYGNVGVDAMIYLEGTKEVLHPVVEINARKTLGYSILEYWKKERKNSMLFAYFTKASNASLGLLPAYVFNDKEKISFERQLTFEIILPFL